MRHILGNAFSIDGIAGANMAGAFTPALKKRAPDRDGGRGNEPEPADDVKFECCRGRHRHFTSYSRKQGVPQAAKFFLWTLVLYVNR